MREQITEEILDKVFFNRNETNQTNQDLCTHSIGLTLNKVGKIIDGFSFSSEKEENIEIKRELKKEIGVEE